ncbi:DUF1616 domain-containing protein [Halosimplex litoreum]|uniref:DUF1616 domain-containing protein n=1 Tax=Halosimplex litoreum TaxID=1198301 RepID=A0A7T3FYR5_9EURY|nr:DUF1616 domain-containing protein [Halosimplex litoreum]QPV63228.1 DUF1616 domain-containing protein [Halosimplex litoreum]
MSFITDAGGAHSEAKSLLKAAVSHPTALAVFVTTGGLVVQLDGVPGPVRTVVALPLVFFAPGYMLAATIYPERYTGSHGDDALLSGGGRDRHGLHPLERIALSIGLSVAIVPLLGVAVWAAFGEFTRALVLAGLVSVVGLLLPVALARRYGLAPDRRLVTRPRTQIRRFGRWLSGSSTAETATNVVLVASIVLAAGAFTYGVAVPVDGESYSTAALLTDQDGGPTAEGYPTNFTAGEPESLTIQVTNSENAETKYTIVETVERVTIRNSGIDVVDRSELGRERVTLREGATARLDREVAPDLTGESLQLSYYVYKGSAPEQPSRSTAYRDLHLWITVEPA